MIKGIIIDVDGVVIGEKRGINFPEPHINVLKRLKSIQSHGISISLCTAKPYFSIQNIVTEANLNSLHITNGGGVITDPLDGITLKSHFIAKETAKKIVETCLEHGTYVEFYTLDSYFVQKDKLSHITKLHTDIVQHEPTLVESVLEEIDKHAIVKIMPIVKDDRDMNKLDGLLDVFRSHATISWGSHPVALPLRFGIITAKGISKKQATSAIAANNNIKLDEILGIGDSTADWQFIEQCGYAGAMGNASETLKQLVSKKGKRSFIGKTVDENGVIDIFDYFGL